MNKMITMFESKVTSIMGVYHKKITNLKTI